MQAIVVSEPEALIGWLSSCGKELAQSDLVRRLAVGSEKIDASLSKPSTVEIRADNAVS
ncbi:MAG TPA: hypothetical protein VK446_01195 [Methylocystis sp.]|nr:hypothetical protein [Methylocystis sp.]